MIVRLLACVLLAAAITGPECGRAAEDGAAVVIPAPAIPALKPSQAADGPLQAAPPEYRAALQTAIRAFNARDFDATIQAVGAAEAIRPPTALTLNMRGAALLEQKKFDEASAFFRKALELDAKFYPARFNFCEVPFAQARYPEARAMFEKLLAENDADQLARYRILLTWLLEKNDEEARRTLDSIPFPGDTPAYYYAQAAWEFAHAHEDEAKKWVARGNWVFKPAVTANFSQPFVALGWLAEPPPTTGRLPGASAAPLGPPPKLEPAPIVVRPDP